METKLTLKNMNWKGLIVYMTVVCALPVIIIYFGMSVVGVGAAYANAAKDGSITTPMTNEMLAVLLLFVMGIQIVSFGLLYLNQNAMLYPLNKKDILKTSEEK